jgi:hypothetical protein
VPTVSSASEAKDFLVSCVVSQAQREGAPLSDVERKMLYFSETSSPSPAMREVNEEFERHYDQEEYERKLARLIRNACRRLDDGERRRWDAAVNVLRRGDHYVLVILDRARIRPRGDLLKLVLTAIVVTALLMAVVVFSAR